ncbi:MAG: hypothetical protein HRT38_02735 [Alteromonadaceae bacterium]|nr:hypothetical protein [Alteromonadaceae bacterium]
MPNRTLKRNKNGTYTTTIEELPSEKKQKKQVGRATDRPEVKAKKSTTKTSPTTTKA